MKLPDLSPRNRRAYHFVLSTMLALLAFDLANMDVQAEDTPIPVILDSDANNELDDQHAIAYMLFNGHVFDLKGITVNRTRHGGNIELQVEEAERVVALCGLQGQVKVLAGASKDFDDIRGSLGKAEFDGSVAVDFIIEQALAQKSGKLLLLPIGKLTNIALALEKAPEIEKRVRIVWLGSNYPQPGEYNLENDPAALNYILGRNVPFEMVTVRYGEASGTDAVRITPDEVKNQFAGKGPYIDPPITGRHGQSFHTFGDYAVDLFSNIDLYGDPPARALFDMAAIAIVKNPDWAKSRSVHAPKLSAGLWVEQAGNPRQLTLWEHFNRDAIIEDFLHSLENPVIVSTN